MKIFVLERLGWLSKEKKKENLTNEELKKLEMIQHRALCCLQFAASHMALLNKVRMWKIEDRVKCRKIMMLLNITHGDDSRLIKMIEELERDEEIGT